MDTRPSSENGSNEIMTDTPAVSSEIGPWAAVPIWVLEHDLSASELKVYIALRSYSGARLGGGNDQGIFPHVGTVAERAHVTQRTAEKAIAKLRKLGLLTSTRRHNELGHVTGCVYHLLDLPVAPPQVSRDRREGVANTTAPNRRNERSGSSRGPKSGPQDDGPNRPNGREGTGEMDGGPPGEMDGAIRDQREETSDLDASHDQSSIDSSSQSAVPSKAGDTNSTSSKPIPIRLAGLSNEQKVAKLTGAFIKIKEGEGYEVHPDWRSRVGDAIWAAIEQGRDNKWLIGALRVTASQHGPEVEYPVHAEAS